MTGPVSGLSPSNMRASKSQGNRSAFSAGQYELRVTKEGYDPGAYELTLPSSDPVVAFLHREPPILVYSGSDPLSEVTNEVGEVRVRSVLDTGTEQYDMTMDLGAQDSEGNPVEGAEVYYGQYFDKVVVFVKREGFAPALIVATPDDFVDDFGAEITGGSGKGQQIILLAIGLVVTITAITLAEIKFIKSVEGQQKFYLTDQVNAGEGFVENCKTFEEVTDFINDRVQTVLSGTSIITSFLLAPAGGQGTVAEIGQIMFDAGTLGAEAIRDALLEGALESYGIAGDAMLGEKVLVRTYFDTDDDAAAKFKNLVAPFEIIKGDPSCTSDSTPPTGETFTNSIGMEFIRIPAGTFEMGDIQGGGGRR